MTDFRTCAVKRHDPRLGKTFEDETPAIVARPPEESGGSCKENTSSGEPTTKSAKKTTNENGGDVIDTPSFRAERERQRGNLHFRRGEFPEAIKCYTRAIASDSQCVAAYCNRGFSHLKLQDYAKAASDFTQALAIDPRHVKSLLRRARSFNGLGRHKAAKLDLERARAVAPSTRALKAEYAKTCELVQLAARRSPRTNVGVTTLAASVCKKEDEGGTGIGDDDVTTTAFGPSLPKQTRSAKISVESSEPRVSTKPATTTTAITTTTTVERKAPATLASRTPRRVLSPARTAYEFRRIWNSLAKTSQRQSEYLKSITDHSSRLFKKSIENDLFVSVIRVLNEHQESWDRICDMLKLMEAFAKSERFKVLLMLLSRDETSLLRELFGKIEGRCQNDGALLKRTGALRRRYGVEVGARGAGGE